MNVLLTGKRQVGKTTVCKQVAELARGLGHDPAGVLTRVGIAVRTVIIHA